MQDFFYSKKCVKDWNAGAVEPCKMIKLVDYSNSKLSSSCTWSAYGCRLCATASWDLQHCRLSGLSCLNRMCSLLLIFTNQEPDHFIQFCISKLCIQIGQAELPRRAKICIPVKVYFHFTKTMLKKTNSDTDIHCKLQMKQCVAPPIHWTHSKYKIKDWINCQMKTKYFNWNHKQ